MNNDCLFCRIIAGTAPGDILYRDEQVTAFRDIHPAAPVHVLIVPNKHIASINGLEEADDQISGRLLRTARLLAEELGISQAGYRVIINTGADGGQVIHHLHLHLLGGRSMRHPLG
jgi:histidine triad (HIT) family protein